MPPWPSLGHLAPSKKPPWPGQAIIGRDGAAGGWGFRFAGDDWRDCAHSRGPPPSPRSHGAASSPSSWYGSAPWSRLAPLPQCTHVEHSNTFAIQFDPERQSGRRCRRLPTAHRRRRGGAAAPPPSGAPRPPLIGHRGADCCRGRPIAWPGKPRCRLPRFCPAPVLCTCVDVCRRNGRRPPRRRVRWRSYDPFRSPDRTESLLIDDHLRTFQPISNVPFLKPIFWSYRYHANS